MKKHISESNAKGPNNKALTNFEGSPHVEVQCIDCSYTFFVRRNNYRWNRKYKVAFYCNDCRNKGNSEIKQAMLNLRKNRGKVNAAAKVLHAKARAKR